MELPYIKPLIFPLWAKVSEKASMTLRYALKDDGIVSQFNAQSSLPYNNHIEMSGFQMSTILSHRVRRDLTPDFYRLCVFPNLRTVPNDTHGSLLYAFPGYDVSANNEKEKIESIFFNGILTFQSNLAGAKLTRRFIPAYNKMALIEEITVETDFPISVRVRGIVNTMNIARIFSPDSKKYRMTQRIHANGAKFDPHQMNIPCKVGTTTFHFTYSAEDVNIRDIRTQTKLREDFIKANHNRLRITTPDDNINRMIDFCKLRASESIFDTKGGLMHAPGSGYFYAALWTNDQCEYANPMFAYLGYDKANEQSVNCYDWFSRFAKPNKAIPSSIIAGGDDIWAGAGDRGDSSMYLYGLSRYLLTVGNKKLAEKFMAPMKTVAQYVLSQVEANGTVRSDSDELENRFKSGEMNLSTAVLSYDALLSLSYLMKEFGDDELEKLYLDTATKIRSGIETYFGATVEGFNTYRYCAGEKNLRSWICLPLTVGIFDRADDTTRAMLSSKLNVGNGILTRSGEKTYWDRSALYGMSGMFHAGQTKPALSLLQSYTNERLLGEHVPYPVEAYPEGNAAHLSAESALFVRIFVEGILGLRPTGFGKFNITLNLPNEWSHLSFENIELREKKVSITIERTGRGEPTFTVRFVGENLDETKTLKLGETTNIAI